jgi:hypothetical protein
MTGKWKMRVTFPPFLMDFPWFLPLRDYNRVSRL